MVCYHTDIRVSHLFEVSFTNVWTENTQTSDYTFGGIELFLLPFWFVTVIVIIITTCATKLCQQLYGDDCGKTRIFWFHGIIMKVYSGFAGVLTLMLEIINLYTPTQIVSPTVKQHFFDASCMATFFFITARIINYFEEYYNYPAKAVSHKPARRRDRKDQSYINLVGEVVIQGYQKIKMIVTTITGLSNDDFIVYRVKRTRSGAIYG